MKPGDIVPLSAIVIDQHFTEPPPRFSEASLVKTLEEYGIGRPSTYASIIQTLLAREYVMLDSRRFRPSEVGRAVAKFLSGHFTRYVDYDFTAKLEDELDAVSRGEEDWLPLLERFWKPFKSLIDDKIETVDRSDASGSRVLGSDPKTGLPVSVRLGRYGPFAQIGTKEDADKPRFASLRAGQSMHTITLEDALELFKLPRTLGAHEGEEVTVGVGRFGPFVKLGSMYASLKTEDDPYTIDLARAVQLVAEKLEAAANRLIKKFEGSPIEVVNGRYGPYVTDGEKNGKIPKDVEPASLTLADCEAIMATAPARGAKRGGRFGAKKTTEKVAAAKSPTAVKKAAAKKAPAKKVAAGKAPAKKTAAKKAPAKKTAVKKSGSAAPPF
jgi:DNA topoisomerase I